VAGDGSERGALGTIHGNVAGRVELTTTRKVGRTADHARWVGYVPFNKIVRNVLPQAGSQGDVHPGFEERVRCAKPDFRHHENYVAIICDSILGRRSISGRSITLVGF
jgi:hypothetical protein